MQLDGVVTFVVSAWRHQHTAARGIDGDQYQQQSTKDIKQRVIQTQARRDGAGAPSIEAQEIIRVVIVITRKACTALTGAPHSTSMILFNTVTATHDALAVLLKEVRECFEVKKISNMFSLRMSENRDTLETVT